MTTPKYVALVACAVVMATCLVASGAVAARQRTFSYSPPNGFVPDQTTATSIAEAVWIPIWGEESIRAERPFVATLDGDVAHGQ